jgi:hypothetical protein
MDARREPRFEIYGPVKVTPLSRPDRDLDSVLLDISATGLKVIAPENLPVDEIIAVESEDHLALADIRYSQARGDKFTLGCERIHLLQKVTLPKDRDKVEQIRILIADYRDRIRGGMAMPRPDVNGADAAKLDLELLGEPPSTEPLPAKFNGNLTEMPAVSPFATRIDLLEAAAKWVVERWDHVAAPVPEPVPTEKAVADSLGIQVARRTQPPVVPVAPPTPEIEQPVPTEQASPAEPQAKSQPSEEITLARSPSRPPKQNKWRLIVGLAATAILGWGISAWFWSSGTTGSANPLPPSIASLIAPRLQVPPANSTNPSVRHAVVKAVESTWVEASSDGKHVFTKKLARNDSREFDFSDKAVLRLGNARGVDVSVDGKSLGLLGRNGQTRVVEISAAGLKYLPVK